MQPYEELIASLGELLGTALQPDSKQTCTIDFPNDNVIAQVDLDTRGDRVLVGSDLGDLMPGPHREQVFRRALLVNGLPRTPRGLLAYSERKDTLILYQYLNLATLDGEKLHSFLTRFVNHARLWKEAISRGDVPQIEGGPTGSSGMLGLS